jgi:protein-S-isoprenylcysteine O-methyltransferase Ste14
MTQSEAGGTVKFSQAYKRRSWTDWVGCSLYVALAVDIAVHSPQIGILLLPSVLHELLVAGSFLIRRPLCRQAEGWKPRLAAYSGTFLVIGFIRFASTFEPSWVARSEDANLKAVGVAIWLLGTLFGIYSLWYFRYAFSLVPQARVLVTSGPFRIARHPIYLSYLFQYLGILLTHLTIAFGLLLLVWFGIMLIRMRYEESILMEAFPEYSSYRSQVRALYPRLPRVVIAPKASLHSALPKS